MAPILFWTRQALDGKNMSGVTVAKMIRSISAAIDSPFFQNLFCRFGAQVAGRRPFIDDTAFADARPFVDPFVGSVDELALNPLLVTRRSGRK